MRGFRGGIGGLFGLAAAMAAPVSLFAQSGGQIASAIEERAERLSGQVRRRRSSAFVHGQAPKYRNRWKAERPKRRRNMMHVSRRVRRRHRRRA